MTEGTETSHDYSFKVLLKGGSGVGKSSLLLRYTDDAFTADVAPTAGADYKVKSVEHEGKKVQLQMWDTGGQEKYRKITASYYIDANAVLLVYDVTNQESFDNLNDWLPEISAKARGDASLLLVGNKCDLVENRAVDKETAEKFAADNGIPYMEVSAMAGTNVNELFEQAIKNMIVMYAEDLTMERMKFSKKSRRLQRRSAMCSIL